MRGTFHFPLMCMRRTLVPLFLYWNLGIEESYNRLESFSNRAEKGFLWNGKCVLEFSLSSDIA